MVRIKLFYGMIKKIKKKEKSKRNDDNFTIKKRKLSDSSKSYSIPLENYVNHWKHRELAILIFQFSGKQMETA